MQEKSHKLAAIVFTDIVGYTKRMEENEQKTMLLLQQQREIIFPLVESYGGKVVKEIGDGLMMMFDSAVQAVRFAISTQTRLKDEELTIRAGIHIGDVIFKDGDVFGSAVNTAARIEPLASPNGICISDDVRSQLHNKSEIIAISLGRKDLKGVKESIEIFEIFIEGVSEKRTRSLGFFFRDLWNRRVLQILTAYILAAWIIKFAVTAIVSGNMLSPHLIDLTWVILLSLIPAVFLLSYFHGKRSSGKWTKIELFGLPANAFLSVLLVFILFNGKDLGGATDKVIVQNEDGKNVELTVVKNAFRKNIALFFYENTQIDSASQWLAYGIPALLEYDLSQDMFVRSVSAINYLNRFEQDGYNDGLDTPLLYKMKIASSNNLSYFVTGNYSYTNGKYAINTQVYLTKTGKLLNEFSNEGENLFHLADEISVLIKKQTGLSDQQIEKLKNMPVKEIFTNSIDALRLYITGIVLVEIENNYDAGILHLEEALEIDQEFAKAYLDIAQQYFNNNQLDKVNAILPKMLKHKIKLPERDQYIIKFFYYIIKQEADKALAVVRMWAEIFPDDIEAHILLAERLQLKSNNRAAINEYKTILTLDPERHIYTRQIGTLYERLGEFDSALIYHQNYAERFPEDYISYRNLAHLFFLQNDFQNAIKNYDRALLLEPEKVSILLSRANIDRRLGKFDLAYNKYLDVLMVCQTARDSARVYSAFDNYYTVKGKIHLALEYYEKEVAVQKNNRTPLDWLVDQTFNIFKYVMAGKPEKGMEKLKAIEPQFKPPVDKVIAFGYMFYYLELEDTTRVVPYIEMAKELIHGFGQESLMVMVYYAEGRVDELKGNYPEAIASYMKFLEQNRTDINIMIRLGACYRKNGEMKKSLEILEKALAQSPFYPTGHLEIAKLYMDEGDEEKASEHLKTALEVWKDADADYKYSEEARELFNQISGV